MKLKDALHQDHQKAEQLFEQVQKATDAATIEKLFTELSGDLNAHATAEEEVVYPLARSFVYDDIGERYEEQDKMKETLKILGSMDFSSSEFKTKLNNLKEEVQEHVKQEESEMMDCFDRDMTDQEQAEIVEQFEAAKKDLKEKVAA
ncbi:MAG: hemerythrin domain-containing protein [Geitlerinemataceae cyanobacterium]